MRKELLRELEIRSRRKSLEDFLSEILKECAKRAGTAHSSVKGNNPTCIIAGDRRKEK